jgi:uncharacterized membrane protein
MISNLWHLFRRFARKLWARTALVSALAFVGPVLAQGLKIVLPDEFLVRVDREDVRALLDILANSMLAVTTFSLTIMVTAHLAADQVASPRAHRILREDGRTQTVLATFVGAFVFALVSIVMLQTGVLGKEELAALYLMTLVVLGLIIVTILRWIGQLSGLGSTENTTLTVQERAAEALRERCASPFLGGRALSQDRAISEAEHAVAARQSGYVQNIDMQELDEAMEEWSGAIYLCAAPGAWVAAGDPLALVTLEDLDGAQEGRIASAFVIGATRTYGQDAAFGMSVLTEIAERALSPSINDPRTAIDVVSRLSHLLQSFEGETEPADPACRHVFAPPLDAAAMVADSFGPIARDGRGFVEVQLHLQAVLARLAGHRLPELAEAARAESARALAYAEIGLPLDGDRAAVRKVAVASDPAPYSAAS